MTKYFIFVASLFVWGCTSSPDKHFTPPDVDFMFNDYEERQFEYSYGEYPERVIDSILVRSAELGVKVRGISVMASGFHPVVYVIYAEDKAYLSFFYGGNTVGKGYIRDFKAPEFEEMQGAVYSDKHCQPYKKERIDWVDVHIFESSSGYVICNERGAFLEGGKIRDYFGKKFGERMHWNKYSYSG